MPATDDESIHGGFESSESQGMNLTMMKLNAKRKPDKSKIFRVRNSEYFHFISYSR